MTSAPSLRRTPVHRLTVLYDEACGLCAHLRDWLVRQRQLVPLELVPAGSGRARGLFPGLDHTTTLRRITVIGNRGQVYTDDAAFLVCLWALAEHRATAHRLATPAGKPFVRAAVLAASAYRSATGAADREIPATRDRDEDDHDYGHDGVHQGVPSAGPPCDDRCAPPG
ncbi:thiol-disulfide oxidoreductase DCC family protein [Streptomyces sp. NPDC058953]|uniref:thiol-disulfide oxidoreductase DCC family protein n=1 Tax=unclassified Streptomyces TaxID=2593676 RepID=UPI0036A82BFA